MTQLYDQYENLLPVEDRDDKKMAHWLGMCDRCGGHGGWAGWPGYTCFKCCGSGKAMRAVRAYTVEELEKYKIRSAAYHERKAKKDAEKFEAKRAAVALKRAEFDAGHETLVHDLETLKDGDAFLTNLYDGLVQYGNLTDKQLAVAVDAIERRKKALGAGYAGEVGETITLRVKTLVRKYSDPAHYGWAGSYFTVMEDEAGRCVMYKGSHCVALGKDEGWFMLTGKVKELGEYRGVKQTWVERPKTWVED